MIRISKIRIAMSDDLFDRFKKLNLPIGKYAIFGSGQLAIRELREIHDLDVIVLNDIFDKYKKESIWKVKKFNNNIEYLSNNGIELWQDWGPGEWNIKDLIEGAEIINNLPFVRLEEVLEWKKINNREKDLKDVEIINNHLRIRNYEK